MTKSRLSTRILGTLGTFALFGATLCLAQQNGSTVLPQFAFGDGWYSALYFTNLTGAPVSFPVTFLSDQGKPLSIPSLNGSSKQVTIFAYGTAVIEAPNTGHLVQGYATFSLPAGVGGYGVFRITGDGAPDQEAVVPFSSSSSTSSTLTFDETATSTAVAIVNPSSVAATVAITVLDTDGSTIATSSLTLPVLNHTTAMLASLPGLAGIAGHRGSAQFSASTGSVAVLGLRAKGSAITSIPMTSAFPLVSSIVSGKYVGPSNVNGGKNLITITGPALITGGVLAYTISLSSGASSDTIPAGGTFYVGPLENSPLFAQLKSSNMTSTAWSFGVASNTGVTIGVAQVGNTLSIGWFNYGNTPYNQMTYTLIP